jgi:hypothetical protein
MKKLDHWWFERGATYGWYWLAKDLSSKETLSPETFGEGWPDLHMWLSLCLQPNQYHVFKPTPSNSIKSLILRIDIEAVAVSTLHGRTTSLRKLEKWQRINDGGAFRYPLVDLHTLCPDPEELSHLVGTGRSARHQMFQEHFPELWCWLKLNIDDNEWTIGCRYRGPQVWSFDLLLVLSAATLFEAAWEDHIDETA